ncbi:MAG: metallophosphoesterase [Acidobacteriota bacterium]
MWKAEDLIVLSDIHMAAEQGKGMFQADAELTSFLTWVFEEAPNATMVLAGDILDFLVVEHCERAEKALHPAGAPARTASILEKHPEVFDALGRLARSPEHNVIWMAGNHDPELAFPSVREVIEQRLGWSAAAPPVRWLVHSEAATIRVGEATALIEHGEMFDDWNRIDHDALRRASSLASRGLLENHKYTPPPGSKLVVEYLIELREKYPWLYLLKPEREAVIPIMFAFLERKEQYKLLPALKHWLSSAVRSAITELEIQSDPARIVRSTNHTSTRKQKLVAWLEEMEREPKRRASQADRIERLIPKLREVAAEDDFFDLQTPDSVSEVVTYLLKQGSDLVIHGHTHSAKAYRLGAGLYLNTGTWGRLLRLPPGDASDADWREFLEGLLNGRDEGVTRPTFARVTLDSQSETTDAALVQWDDTGPSTLASWRFDSSDRQWQRD